MGTLALHSQGPESRCRVGVCLAPQGRGRAHLQQREVGQKARVQLFHIVEKFNQVDVSPAQLVAHQVVLSMALQHLGNGGVRSGRQVLAGWTPAPPLPLTQPHVPLCPSLGGWEPQTFCSLQLRDRPGRFLLFPPHPQWKADHHFLFVSPARCGCLTSSSTGPRP